MIGELEEVTGRSVSRETFEKLRSYATLLRTEAAHQNLVSASTLDHLWERHVLDSAQLVRFAPESSATWLDVGSGAGLPGIVLGCLIDSPITLVEPRRLRADFLRRLVQELDLNASVHQAKIERITGKFEVITGRAVAALPRFLSMCDHLSTRKTRWVLPKGRTAQSELAEARSSWQGVFHVEPSVTDEDSRIIVATGVRAKRQ
jgi:16S rRNA (guanine527-N7)-methyltransferase